MRDNHSVEKCCLQAELDALHRDISDAARLRPAPLHMISMLTDTTAG